MFCMFISLDALLNQLGSSCRWKYEGPSDSFKALVDMAAVHSSCRLCIHLATKIQESEEKTARFLNRPCNCTSSAGTVYHLFVRERGRFELESIYLRYLHPLSLALHVHMHECMPACACMCMCALCWG